MPDGDGYWLNPATGYAVRVVRHELTMSNPIELERLGVAADVAAKARELSPYSREGEQALRMLGIESGLVRIRDHGDLVTVQFSAAPAVEGRLLSTVIEFLESVQLWRPFVKLGNFQRGEQTVLGWEELVQRAAPS